MITAYLLTLCVIVFTLLALYWDVRTGRLPNALNVSAFLAALLFHALTSGGPGLLHAAGGFAVGFGVLLVLFLIGGGGGGDVKFMGAVGAWLGPMSTLLVFLLSTFMAVFCLLVVVAYQQLAASKATATAGAHAGPGSEAAPRGLASRKLPYAVPASMATWVILFLRLLTDGAMP